MTLPTIDRLWARTEVNEDGCWIFIHNKPEGYGEISCSGVLHKVHRVSWCLHRCPIPAGLMVLHQCDTPPCWNPEHLFIGDQYDNMRDRAAKGRRPSSHRTNNSNNRLSESDVVEIKELLEQGRLTQQAIANRFFVSQGTISHIKTQRAWK